MTATNSSDAISTNVTGLRTVELLDPTELAQMDGGYVPLPPLWLLASASGGLFVGAAVAGAAFYWYTHR